jgi:hypothetical protein
VKGRVGIMFEETLEKEEVLEPCARAKSVRDESARCKVAPIQPASKKQLVSPGVQLKRRLSRTVGLCHW